MELMQELKRKNNRVLFLGEDVTQESVQDIIKSIYEFNMEDEQNESIFVDYDRPAIHLILNTYGGSVYDGIGLVGAIDLSRTPVVVTCIGSAMSMGLLILASGHLRRMHAYSTAMYHQISSASFDKLEGMRKDLIETERLEKLYDSILTKKTKIKEEDLQKHKHSKSEWFITPKEALKLGIIDEILGEVPVIKKVRAKKV
jgi:ATP-dependent Clp protease protease subunit